MLLKLVLFTPSDWTKQVDHS